MSRASWTPAVGQRFGRLIVVDTTMRTEPRKAGHVGLRRFQCACDCGGVVVVDPSALKAGYSRSCGCIRRERGRERGLASARHGLWQHPLYKIWSGAVDRCHNPASRAYERYGGRGIAVYAPWRADPEAFIGWVTANLGDRPERHSLDRVDNDGDYLPGNLRWADSKTQNNNRSPARWTRWSRRQDIEMTRGS